MQYRRSMKEELLKKTNSNCKKCKYYAVCNIQYQGMFAKFLDTMFCYVIGKFVSKIKCNIMPKENEMFSKYVSSVSLISFEVFNSPTTTNSSSIGILEKKNIYKK